MLQVIAPYLLLPAAFLILFCLSRGFFKASASYLVRNVRICAKISVDALRTALIILFCAGILSLLVAIRTALSDTVREGYLIRNGYGSNAYEEELVLSDGSDEYTVSVFVDPQTYTKQQISIYLDEAEAALSAYLTKENDLSHVETDLSLPVTFPDSPVQCTYYSDTPEVLSSEGLLGDPVPEEGAGVLLTAHLTLAGEDRTLSYALTVFPKVYTADEQFLKDTQTALSLENDPTKDRLQLPSNIGDVTVSWRSKADPTAFLILLLGLLAAALSIGALYTRKQDARRKKERAMNRDYPLLVEKLTLLMEAGMSTRSALERIDTDYTAEIQRGNEKRPGFEEIHRLVRDLSCGVGEAEAYHRFGRRVALSRFRAFAALLEESLLSGSAALLPILAKEADRAFEERRTEAKVRGEEAQTKLLIPMLLELLTVLIIILVPAVITLM